jgi:hypothetical protein
LAKVEGSFALPERKRSMDLSVIRALINENDELEKVFEATIDPWWDSTNMYYEELEDDPTWNVLPAVIYAAYELLGCEKEFITYANIFRTAYFAHYIHTRIKDVEEGQQHNQQMQFSILIGDYFFGRLLKLLVDTNNRGILIPFAGMICSMNEGMVIKHKIDAADKMVTEKTKASIYETAFLSAAIIAEKDDEFKELYRQLGFYIGMCIELFSDISLNAGSIDDCLFEVETIWEQIKEIYLSKNHLLEKLINEMKQMLAVSEAAVV